MEDILCVGGPCAGLIMSWNHGPVRHGLLFRALRRETFLIEAWGPDAPEETDDPSHTYKVVQLQCAERKWFVAVPENAPDAFAIERLINYYATSTR